MSKMHGLERYHRQMLLPGVGEEGQRRLAESSVLLVGCGALGCASADLLARAGVGRITLVDRDVVELTNLQRQTLFDERDAAEGLPKAEAAARRLRAVNSPIRVEAVVADFNSGNAERMVREAAPAVLLDGTDNFETRYLLNDLAVKHGVPYCYGGVVGTRGMQMTVLPTATRERGSCCLRCVFETPPAPGSVPTCDTAGVLGPVVAIVAACQASDAFKLLLGRADLLSPTLLEIDLWSNLRRRLDLSAARRADCPCCGLRGFEFLEGDAMSGTRALCGQIAVQVCPAGAAAGARVDLAGLAERLLPHGEFEVGRFFLRGELARERSPEGAPVGLTVFPDGRAIIRGTERVEAARSIYARFIGG
ncbi:MAG: ThiF family adenylyltransferase [Phycisphaerales bacterium]